MSLFLGIDAGTTELKAALFTIDGELLGVDRQEYQLITSPNSWIELNPEVYWNACCAAVRNVVAQAQVPPGDIASLAISSQAETLIPVDEAGRPTRHAIVWLDNRATEEAELIGREFSAEEVFHVTGQPEITPTWPACKILWIRRNEPDVFERTAKYLLVEDYLLYRMTGQYVTEYSLQTSSIMLDIIRKSWWQPMLDFVGVTPDSLGRLIEPGGLVAPLTPAAAEALALWTSTVAVGGAINQAMGAVGAGNIMPNVVTETTGGALAVVATLDTPEFDPWRRLPCHYHAIKDTYCLLAWGQTAGMALRWFRDSFFQAEVRDARWGGQDPYDIMTRAAGEVPAGAGGLVALPHLEGAACPEFDPAARGVFYGVALKHTRAHFIRAIMESVAYMLRKNLDIVEELGGEVAEIRSLGGAGRSDVWLQIKADVLQKPVVRVLVEEAACLGAAMVSTVAIGAYPDLREATQHMVILGETFEPNPDHRAVYEDGYQGYLELYERLRPMFQRRRGGIASELDSV